MSDGGPIAGHLSRGGIDRGLSLRQGAEIGQEQVKDSQHERAEAGHSGSISMERGDPTLKNGLSEVKSFFKTISIFLIAAIILRASVVEAFKIPSGSMVPTLKIGDHILVSKFNYGVRVPFVKRMLFQFAMPRRGDIVVFTLPDDPTTPDKNESSINIIKRVVGLPGDKIEVEDGRVHINNKLLDESYARWLDGGVGVNRTYDVPKGHLFMLGDNRDKSRDSRYWPSPYLDVTRVKGKALIVYWSWDSFGRIGTIIR